MENNSNTYVAVLTYNEEDNILECINSIKNCYYDDIAVYDGGSSDKTVRICEDLKIKVIVKPDSSISQRRSLAMNKAIDENYKYILFVDADQRLLDEKTAVLIDKFFLEDNFLAGVQLNLVKPNSEIEFNYWQLGFYSRHLMITGEFKNKTVIGTPCFYKINIVKNFTYNTLEIKGSSDDTFFCKQITSSKYKLKSVNIHCTEIVRASFITTLKKAFWYGIGDAEYVINENDSKKRYNHLYHIFIRNTFIYPLKNLNKLLFFHIIFGYTRLFGFLYYMILRPNEYINKS
jgi:glycosyltransferase involved in cell wall biosynthesis